MTKSSSCTVVLEPEEMAGLQERDPRMYEAIRAIVAAEEQIVGAWVCSKEVERVLLSHGINPEMFLTNYAHEVFGYFVGVIGGVQQIGDCPIMATFLEYLKNQDVTTDELFILCTHFRKAMLGFLSGTDLDIRYLFDEISYVFDRNFAGVLQMYSGRLHEKELELAKSVKLLNEYKNAIDESAIVSRTDEKGIITYVNDRFVEVCGFSREELIGTSHNVMRHPDMPREFFAELWRTIKKRDVFHGTIHNRKKNGESYYMDLTIVPIHDPVKEVTEYMGIGYEITRLVEARQEAELAGQAKEYFLSNMSHEIRTPLNAILGFVSLLLDESESPKHRQYLEIIHNSGENLLSIINDILDFSKLRSGEFTVEHQTFNLHGELSHTLELFAPSANKKRITLFSFIDPAIPYEMASDPLRIKQIVSNLLSNAIKFTPYEGCIDVLAQIEDGMLKITVQDNGIGIGPEDQEKIFNAFSQVEHFETRKAGGTGLGLSICKKLAEHMGGSIELESEPGKGSCFTLLLPVERGQECGLQELDPVPFQQLRLGLLSARHRRPEIVALLERYWEILHYDVVDVENVSEAEYDVLFFVDCDTDDATRKAIVDSGRPAVAIMEYIIDSYETAENVTPLHFPIYCTKLHAVMAQAMNLSSVTKMEDKMASRRHFRGHLLVAEDNVANQELVRIILDRYGIDCMIVNDGIEAVEAFKEGAFNLVLMDEQMPRMNGIDAMRKIRAYEGEHGLGKTPIVAVTANVVKGMREYGIRSGYDAYLGKPISLEELEAVFEHYLEEIAPVEPANPSPVSDERRIEGLDMEKLRSELMLDSDDIIMLLEVFLKKMQSLRGELAHAINAKAYASISKVAHSIKGASANFRMEEVQQLARELEEAGSAKTEGYDYQGMYERIFRELEKVRIIGAS